MSLSAAAAAGSAAEAPGRSAAEAAGSATATATGPPPPRCAKATVAIDRTASAHAVTSKGVRRRFIVCSSEGEISARQDRCPISHERYEL